MSLTALAMRICAVRALQIANTLVGTNVLDSQISAIDQTADGALRSDQKRPFIAVYTDSAKHEDDGATGLRGNGMVEFAFNCGVAMTMAVTDKENGQALIEGLPATDAHFEAILDVLACQIVRALSDRDNPWAQVFMDMGCFRSKVQVKSSSAAENTRLACGQLRITMDVFADPQPGQSFAADSHWSRFLALMSAEQVSQLAMFESMLAGEIDPNYPDFEALLGLSNQTANALKLYPFEGTNFATEFSTLTLSEDRS